MIFTILNLFLAVFFICETVLFDKVETKFEDGTNPCGANILILAITTSMYALFFIGRNAFTPDLFTLLMRICFLLEGCMLVNLIFCFTYYGWNYSSGFSYILKLILYCVAGYFIFFRFKEIKITDARGIVITTDYIFMGQTRKMFPWTWLTLYNAIFTYVLPAFGCLLMLTKEEYTATKLDRHKGHVYTLALILMWVLTIAISQISKIYPGYSVLRYYAYVPLMVLIPYGSWSQSAPSGKALISFGLKSLFMYVIPAVFLGVAFMAICVMNEENGLMLAILVGAVVVAVCFAVYYIVNKFKTASFLRSGDYATNLEKELAAIDYSGEMDDIAFEMYKIMNRNAEASSMAVYINGGNATFENAYTSNGKKCKIDNFEVLFESLLNIGRNIVLFSEVETVHVLSPFKDKLLEFFKRTEADAVFILNEGRDVHGIILLGMKAGNDHYKDSDYEIFSKLYSYFFVFGYYMRNISNKEVIGTVNRELRMSSQIITSIQENIDIAKSEKLDAGCIMIPAHNIGGEFVDMVRLTDTRHLFVMGSLSGKGIAASMSMVILKAIIRAYLAETHDFKQLVVKVNRFIRYNLQKGSIFSGMFAIVNFEDDTMYYINCGIASLMIYTEIYNNVIEIQGSGHILGFVDDLSPYIEVKKTQLHKNDIVLATTAGLIESKSLRGEQFGKDRIQRSMVANAMYPAQRMAQFEHDELMRFMSHEMENDVTVLVMKYLDVEKGRATESE